MASLQEQYDDAMYAFSTGDTDRAIAGLTQILANDPVNFDAQLSLGMAFCRKGDYASAIREGLKAERINPKDQLVHTNLSLFYMKAGDKTKAEHHGLQARIASWRTAGESGESDVPLAKPETESPAPPVKFPEMPWKKKPQP
jgi:Tfp pilus assembly protein PilF